MDRLPIMNIKDKRTSELLTRAQVAKRLEMTPKTIDRWAKSGIIKPRYHKLGPAKGRVVLYDWADVCRRLGIEE